MKIICESLREEPMKIINLKKKTMKLLTNKQQEVYENAKNCYICKEKINIKVNLSKIKNIVKLEIIVIIRVNTEVLRIVYVI